MTKKEEKENEMATQESTTANTTDTDQLRIRWDSSNMQSAYANVFNMVGTREEIVLFFGMNQSWDAAAREVKVQLSDRIILSPFVAKRLSIVLNNVVRDYENRYGKLDIEVRPHTDSRMS